MTMITTNTGEQVRVQNYGDFLYDPFGDRFFETNGVEFDAAQRSDDHFHALGKRLADEWERHVIEMFAKDRR